MFSVKNIKEVLIYTDKQYADQYRDNYFLFMSIKFGTNKKLKIYAWDIIEFEIKEDMSPSQVLSYVSKLDRFWHDDAKQIKWVEDNIGAIDLFWHKKRLIDITKEIDKLKKEAVWHLEEIENLRNE
jgi:hypothetical protein